MDDVLVITDKQDFLKTDIGAKVRYNKTEFIVVEIHKTTEFSKFRIRDNQNRISQIILTM